MFQNLELQTDAFALSFYHTLSQIPGVMLASSLIDSVGRRKLVIIGFGCGAAVLTMLSATTQFIHNSHLHDDDKSGVIHESKGYTSHLAGTRQLYADNTNILNCQLRHLRFCM